MTNLAKITLFTFSLIILPVMVGGFIAATINHYMPVSGGLLIGLKFLPVWIAVWLYHLNKFSTPHWLNKPYLVLIGLGFGLIIVPMPIFVLVILGHPVAWGSLALSRLLGRFIQAGAEELIFRGIFLHSIAIQESGVRSQELGKEGSLTPNSQSLAIYSSSLAFLALHLFNTGFNLAVGLLTFIFGVAMARLSLNHKSIWFCVGFHTAWNYISVAIVPGSPLAGKAVAIIQLLTLLSLLAYAHVVQTNTYLQKSKVAQSEIVFNKPIHPPIQSPKGATNHASN